MSQASYGWAGEGKDPKTVDCEWCGDGTKSTRSFAIRRGRSKLPTGQYLYACDRHQDVAYRSSQG